MAKVAIFSLNTHFLLDFGDLDKSFSLGNAHAWHCAHLITILLFMRRWYSSCDYHAVSISWKTCRIGACSDSSMATIVSIVKL